MDFRYYIALCLILVAPSCCSTREERAARAAWGEVDNAQTYPYLALVKTGEKTCAGSITSVSTVLTFCAEADTTSEAYAGLLKLSNKETTQIIGVEKVVADSDLTALKICILKENWKITPEVGVVNLPPNAVSEASYDNCVVLGFGGSGNAARKLEGQKIGGAELCSISAASILANHWYSTAGDSKELQLGTADIGGPVVCDKVQRGINKQFVEAAARGSAVHCNLYIDVAHYRDWIVKAMEEKPGGPDGSDNNNNNNNNNNNTTSSGYSIHSYLNKYSNWKVLLLLCLMAVKFLAY